MTTIASWLADHSDLERIDAELLLMDALALSRAQLITRHDQTLEGAAIAQLADGAARLRSGEPMAYLRGRKEFWGLKLAVDHNVLVPRPDTELIVELCLDRAKPNACVLDLGTGSGAIAIAVKSERPDLEVHASDRSPEALEVAQRNAQTLSADIQFHQADWFQGLGVTPDLVVSNPPYVRAADPALASLRFEPQEALVSGPDGLEDIRLIVAGGAQRQVPVLLIEHGHDQGEAVRALVLAAGYADADTHRDLAGLERVMIASARDAMR